MHWWRTSADSLASDAGYSIVREVHGDGRRYLAWGPDQAPKGWSYLAWVNGRTAHWSGQEPKVTYQVGEHIPQRWPLLGVFETAEEARALCEVGAASAQRVPPGDPLLPR